MGKYDDVSHSLIVRGEELFPMMAFQQPRNWEKIDEVLDHIPIEGERLLTIGEIKYFYE